MGSVPRINCLLAIVPFKKVNNNNKNVKHSWSYYIDNVYQYDKFNKGVSTLQKLS
jgi:hypothetical protein